MKSRWHLALSLLWLLLTSNEKKANKGSSKSLSVHNLSAGYVYLMSTWPAPNAKDRNENQISARNPSSKDARLFWCD